VKILKISASYISSHLCYIFNKAVLAGEFPSCKKHLIVTTIYKKGNRKNCANIRPISLLTSFSKVFEKIIVRRLLIYTDNQQLIADIFQNYFLSLADKITLRTSNNEELENNSINYLHRIFSNPFPIITFENTTKEIKDIIKSLKSKNSFGYDEIPVKILKISTFIVAPLKYIFNRSILSGTFPTRLKYSMVKPLFKKGDNKDIKNYRPISLLTSFSKIFEKMIYIYI
jgi:hypothetical protein